MLTISEDTWPEHLAAGIAAINDPHFIPTTQSLAQRQAAMAEISGIRSGDKIFFYMRGSKDILGLYEATTIPFFDTNPLLHNAQHVNAKLPFRVGFKQIINFQININQEDIWEARDKGIMWTKQQSRGDAIGRHACITLTQKEGEYLLHLFREKNLIENNPIVSVPNPPTQLISLPLDLRVDNIKKYNVTAIHYEDSFKALLIKDLCNGKHKNIFGDFDDAIPNVPISSGKEIDVLLLKYDKYGVVRYLILELKAKVFDLKDDLRQLVNYGDWTIKVRENANTNNVHLFAVASCFEQKIIDYVKLKKENDEEGIKLIQYQFNQKTNQINLQDVSP